MIERLTLIGVGMIGGSLALALRQGGFCGEIVGYDRDIQALQKALESGVIDRYAEDPCAAVSGAEVVVLATPVRAVEAICRTLRDCLAEETVLTDVGSVKGDVVRAVVAGFGRLPQNFVPGHPIAGKERSGIEAASADLFVGRRVILTPVAGTSAQAQRKVRLLWECAGSVVEDMALEHHDEVLAATSHLPHLLAFTLVASLSRLGESDEIFRYAAGGFRDFTRIASSDPIMWRDVCLSNRDAILNALNHFEHDLQGLSEAIAAGDGRRLLELFSNAKRSRDRFCH
ncbi:prephenate dehydrogenase [Acidihalobacter ferrooxydans]|uniref:prephenate dehydrogenase n=1 Tax=Acidihalobacter ferrooxydans TaxID=1765967 RepID=A0A1P8UG24_9GAMM|nr:prephenate dehydrogenase/arogenate dehydrogenase family protein [Acidihalobacter ferrooxydans]APZ42808.1 prephenate dehydrogenase [Acidihalobacter ferrooxydans]